MTALSLILDALAPVEGRAFLDVGCGAGALAASLARHGAIVIGLDPNAQAIEAARLASPSSTFFVGSAEALPVADASQDGVVMLNSLHHVPDPAAALREAARVLRPGRPLLVVEPMAEGSFFEAMRLVEDETAVRAAALAAVSAAIKAGAFRCDQDLCFERLEHFAALDGFLDRVAAVDPARLAVIAARRSDIGDTVARVAEHEAEDGFLLRQPLRAQVLVPDGGAA